MSKCRNCEFLGTHVEAIEPWAYYPTGIYCLKGHFDEEDPAHTCKPNTDLCPDFEEKHQRDESIELSF